MFYFYFCFFLFVFFLFLLPKDLENASGSEVRLSIRDHLEARCVVAAQSFVHWTACGPTARLVGEI